jgi:hypothetical protein
MELLRGKRAKPVRLAQKVIKNNFKPKEFVDLDKKAQKTIFRSTD